THMITALRPLSTSELLDRTFHLYRNNFVLFVAMFAIPQLFAFAVILTGAALIVVKSETALLTNVIGYLLLCLASFVSQAPIVLSISDNQMGQKIGVAGAFSRTKVSTLRVIWIMFLLFIAISVFFGVVGLVIAVPLSALAQTASATIVGIITSATIVIPLYVVVRSGLTLSLMIPATVVEGGWFLSSMRRSRALAKGNLFRIFTVSFLISLLGVMVAFLLRLLVMMPAPFYGARDFARAQAEYHVLQAVGIFVSISLVGPLATIALTLIYYDQRVRKEGFDLQLMMAALQPGSAPPAAAAAAPNS
ncbi:MAG TPA: hypothetical protein VF447_05715, partial [Terriglobales bacterium]